MATIYPFRALRYNPARVAVADVVTQPYDKITPAMQTQYYEQSPYNLVRVILGRREPDDNGTNVYTRAAAHFKDWREGGVLKADAEPSIYAYSQRFTIPGGSSKGYERKGFIALGKIEDYDTGIVHRHEQTLSGPKIDRLNLLRATRAHFGQIFMLYSDPERLVDELLFPSALHSKNECTESAVVAPAPAPDCDVTDEYGVQHRMWKVSDPRIIHSVQEVMLNKKLIIADGHHRYETALNYRNERRAQAGGTSADSPYERVMMTFVNTEAEGLVVLPTHRVVFGLPNFNPASFVERARAFFSINALRERVTAEGAVRLLEQRGAQTTALLAATPSTDFILEANSDLMSHPLLSALSPLQRQLDVVLLHKLLLEHVLGISEEAIRDQANIRYLRSAGESIQQVTSGDANLAFLMNPVRVSQVRDIAFAGEVMPQKSTDFYPKLLTGLTVYALE